MLNNISQEDHASGLPPIDKFEKKGVDYFLNNIQIPSVSTILGGGGGGKASANGNALHEAMASFLLGHHKEQGISVKELFKNCNNEDFSIPIKLSEFLKEKRLKPLYVEHKFYYEVDGCKFAGTVDLVCIDADGNLYVFDYKSGVTKDAKHHRQVSTYAKSIGAIKGFIVYRDEIVRVDNSLFETEFKPRLLAYHGKLQGKFWHGGNIYSNNATISEFSHALKELKLKEKALEKQAEQIKKQQEKLKEEIEELKALATANLNIEKKEQFLDDNIMLSWCKGKTSKKLTEQGEEELEKLKKANPSWFITTKSKDYYMLRLATETGNKDK